MKKKASITIFLSLLIAASLALIRLLFQSVEIQNARVNMESGMEEGLYSLFADYNRELFDRYHVFFIEGGYGTGKMQPGKMYKTVEDGLTGGDHSYNFQDIHLGKRQNMSVENGEITGYTLASDHAGDAFYMQAVKYMEETAGIQGVQALINRNEKRKRQIEDIESQDNIDIAEEAEKQYLEAKKAQENSTVEENTVSDQEKQGESGMMEVEIPDNFKNPLDTIKEIKKRGILGLVLSGETEVSAKVVEKSLLYSHRALETGMGIVEKYSEEEKFYHQALFEEYLIRHFNCYGQEKKSHALEYEIEYLIGGKTDDQKNLKSVVHRLIAVRQGANMAYLLKDQESREQIKTVALIICAVTKMPSLEGIVRTVLTAAWAYAESICDVRELLEGGAVPLLKEKNEWQLSLSPQGDFIQQQHSDGGESGLTYQEYLRILLMTVRKETQIARAMDLVELVMRTAGSQSNFRMDLCVWQVQITMEVNTAGRKFSMQRGYRYDR